MMEKIVFNKVEKVRELVELARVVDAGTYLHAVKVDPEEVDWSLSSGGRDHAAKVLERLQSALSKLPNRVGERIGFDLNHRRLFEEYEAIASFSPDPLPFDLFSELLTSDQEFFLRWSDNTIRESAKRYEWLRSVYNRIYQLLEYLEQRENYPDEVKDLIPVPKVFNSMVAFLGNALVQIPDEFTLALDGTDLSKLKRCPACKRAFWISRKDQKGCTRACGKVLRTRKWRERTTSEQRRRYQVNRALKEMKKEKKQNGVI